MKIKLFTKDNEISQNIRIELEEMLVSNGYELSNKDDFEVGISIGGDGQFIKMLHQTHFDNTKKYVGINTGNLGYMTSVDKDELNSFIKDLNTNNLNIEKVKYLSIKINSNDEYDGLIINAINEVTLRNTLLSTLYLSTFINNQLLYKLSGDGINVCTPYGSTAYNQSLGGSIIDSSFNAIEITPIAPINNNINKNITSSFITSDKNKIIIKPSNKENSISLIADGKITPIKDLISVEITMNDSLNFIKDVEYNNIIDMNNKIYK